MKKLSLKKLNLNADDLLQREQLKTVFGGYDGFGGCSVTCEAGYYACCNDSLVGADSCTCHLSFTTHTCSSGGPHSSSCSIAS